MKRTLIALFAVLVLAFANPSATAADKPDDVGKSQVQAKDDDCKKKGCGQPHGQSCKNPNPHKTWCASKDGDNDDDEDEDEDESPDLANTGV